MKTHFSTPEYAKKFAVMQQNALNVYPPPILFKKPKKEEKDIDDDKQYQKISVPLGDTEDTTEWKVPLFEDGDPEEWIKWKIQYDQLAES